jgi:hypothetical protein
LICWKLPTMRNFDWGNYIARSLLRAGLKDDDQQEAAHQIVIKFFGRARVVVQEMESSKARPAGQKIPPKCVECH